MTSLSSPSASPASHRQAGRIYGMVALAVVAWLAAYALIQPLANWLAYSAFQLPQGKLGESVAFFLYDVPKILLLLAGMIFLISIIRTFFSPERTRALLGGKREGVPPDSALCRKARKWSLDTLSSNATAPHNSSLCGAVGVERDVS